MEDEPIMDVLASGWKPVTWTETERNKGQAWGLETIDSFHPTARRRYRRTTARRAE